MRNRILFLLVLNLLISSIALSHGEDCVSLEWTKVSGSEQPFGYGLILADEVIWFEESKEALTGSLCFNHNNPGPWTIEVWAGFTIYDPAPRIVFTISEPRTFYRGINAAGCELKWNYREDH